MSVPAKDGRAKLRRVGGKRRAAVEVVTVTGRPAPAGKGGTFRIVGIGASAGGLSAVGELLANLPVNATRGRKRILLVEDHEATRVALSRLLTNRGYEVTAAGSVAQARSAADAQRFELLVSDIGLPDGSGHELMMEMRDRFGMKGVALTGYGTEEDIARTKVSGFTTHLIKPITVQTLEIALAAATQ